MVEFYAWVDDHLRTIMWPHTGDNLLAGGGGAM